MQEIPPQYPQPGQYVPPMQPPTPPQPQPKKRKTWADLTTFEKIAGGVIVAIILSCIVGCCAIGLSGLGNANAQTQAAQPTATNTPVQPITGYLVSDASGAIFIVYQTTDATHVAGYVRMASVSTGTLHNVKVDATGVRTGTGGHTITLKLTSSAYTTAYTWTVRELGDNISISWRDSTGQKWSFTLHPATQDDYDAAVTAL